MRVFFDCGSRFCEWTLKLFGWLVLVGVLMQLDGGNFIWSSPAGTAFLVLLGFLVFSATNCSIRIVYWMDQTQDPNIQRYIVSPIDACLARVYRGRHRVSLLAVIFAIVISVPACIAMWFAANWILPFVAQLVIAVVDGTAAGCGPGSGSGSG